jgi:hypothetical protein
MGQLLASCILGCALSQFVSHRYARFSGLQYFLAFHFYIVIFYLLDLILMPENLRQQDGLVSFGLIYALTCTLFLIMKALDNQDERERWQAAANGNRKAAITGDEKSR